MRKEIALLAGSREWGDTRESWLSRVPRAVKRELGTAKETVSYRTVKSLFYGAIADPNHHAARDITRAAQLMTARREALELAEKFRGIIGGLDAANSNRFSADIARLERVARILGGGDRPG